MGNEYQHPYPLATDTWIAAVHKAAILFGQQFGGQVFSSSSQSGQSIPAHDEQIISYIGSTNNKSVIVYKLAGQNVAQQTFEYAASGAADNDRVTRIQLTLY